MIETALIVGAWCMVSSAVNGWNTFEQRYEPRTYIYERKVDCDPDSRLIIVVPSSLRLTSGSM